MWIEFLIRIIKRIQKLSRPALLVLLTLSGLILAEFALHMMGRYENIPSQNLFKLLRTSLATPQDILRFKTAKPEFRPHPAPEEYRDLRNYEFRQLPYFDFDYGMALIPNCPCYDVFKHNGEVIWDVQNNIDGQGRRVVPASASVKSNRFIVFYGGSRTFGYGVQDNETLPNRVQELIPDFKVYNYGIASAAAHVFLKQHEDDVFKRQIPEKKGLFLYVFDFTHDDRILGTRYVPWSYKTPRYTLDEKGEPVYRGTFWSDRFWTSLLYDGLAQSAIYQNLFMDVKRRNVRFLSPEEMKLVTAVFLKMKQEAELMNGSGFAVVFFESGVKHRMPQIEEALAAAGVETIVLSAKEGQLPPYDEANFFKYDGHPKPSYYVEEARALKEELVKRKLLTN